MLGIDLGQRRIGLAIADTASGAVEPLATLRRTTPERDRQTIARLCREQHIDELIVGLPLNLDGTHGAQAADAQAWANAVLGELRAPVSFRDERLTTERAQARVGPPRRGSAGGPPSTRARRDRSARLDREAAALILQAELDARAGVGSQA